MNDSILLGSNTSMRLKQKIWADQFVDFKPLLPNQKDTTVSIQINQNSVSFSNQTTSKTQSPLSIEQWTTAFFTFMSIFIKKKPQDAPHLLKYGFTIREIASSHGDSAWRHYDENFRKLRQSHSLPWQRMLSELMVTSCTMHKPKQNFRPNFRSSFEKHPKVCFNFNNGTKCRSYPCPFKHLCQFCRESHPRIKCAKNHVDTTRHQKHNSNTSKRSDPSI